MADKKKSVAKAYVQVVPTVDGIKGTLTKEFGGAVSSSFGDVFKGTLLSGALLGAAKEIGGAILDIGRDAIDAAADVKAANAQFSQTFGTLKGTATAALRAVSSETGIATTRLQSGYTALYAFTKSVGGDSSTALNIAQRALKAAADSAAYYDRSVEEATETLQSFLKGNYANDAALGIAATETTRNAMANKLYAKSFIELSESQKVDTLLAMVEAGNKASGAMGQAAREADSWTNVTGELAEASRQLLAQWGSPIMEGLIPMIQGATEALKGMTEQTSFEILDQGIADFRAGIEAADDAFQSTTTSIAATSNLAQRYVDRLRELEGAGLDTAESQREYKQVVELLNELMPELSLTINEVTGRLEQNTWAIEDNIRSLREQAENQAKMAYYKTIIDEYTAASEAQFAAEMQLMELQEKKKILVDQLTVANSEYTATLGGSTEAQARERAYVDELTASIAALDREEAALTSSLDTANVSLSEAESKLERAEAGYAKLAGSTATATAAADEQSKAVEALGDAYNTTKAAARESIDSQIGLFEELAKESDWSAAKIIENWEHQQQAFANYEDNLQKAVELGLDETLVKQLSDGSQQSMQILDALVNDTEISIDEINAAFGGMSQARDEVSQAMADIQFIFDESLSGMIEAAGDAAADVIDGFVLNLTKGKDRVYNAGHAVGRSGIRGTRDSIQSHSPSRAYMDIADDSIDGLIIETQRRTQDYVQTQQNLAKAGMSAMQTQMEAAASYPSTLAFHENGGSGTINNHNVSLGGVALNIYQQPGEDVNQLADRVIDRLSVLYEQGGAAFG